MNRKNLFVIFKYLLLVLFLVGFYLYFKNNSENFKSLKEISFSQFSLIFALNFMLYAVNGVIIHFFMRCFNIQLKFLEQFYLSVMTTFGNYFLPFRGGAALRGVYLKQRYQFKYSLFFVAMMAQLLLVLLVALTAMFFFAGHLFYKSSFTNYQLLLSVSVLGFLVSIPLLFSKNIYRLIKVRIVRKAIFPLYRGWRFICRRPSNLAFLFIFCSLNLVVISLMLYFELRFLGITLDNGHVPNYFDALFISVFNSLSSILIITPGAIGIRESMMMAASSFVSFSPEDILVASVLDRAVNIIFIIMAMAVTSLLMRRVWKKS